MFLGWEIESRASFTSAKHNQRDTGEMVSHLRALATPPENWVLFPAPTLMIYNNL